MAGLTAETSSGEAAEGAKAKTEGEERRTKKERKKALEKHRNGARQETRHMLASTNSTDCGKGGELGR